MLVGLQLANLTSLHMLLVAWFYVYPTYSGVHPVSGLPSCKPGEPLHLAINYTSERTVSQGDEKIGKGPKCRKRQLTQPMSPDLTNQPSRMQPAPTNLERKQVSRWGKSWSLARNIATKPFSSYGCESTPMVPFWLVGEFTTHLRTYSGGWIESDVRWGLTGLGILKRPWPIWLSPLSS